MNIRRYQEFLGNRRSGWQSLSVILGALFTFQWVILTEPITISSASTVIPVQTGSVYVVNNTGDAAGVGLLSNCDTDPLTPGEQCTLRAALRATNSTAGVDTIRFNIPATDPGCDPATGRCVINLSQALPNISGGVAIEGPGLDRLTVRRNTSTNFRIFTVTAADTVSFSGLTIADGNVGPLNDIGGGILADGGDVNITNSVVSNNVAAAGGGVTSGINHTGVININDTLIFANQADGTGGISGGGGIAVISGAVNLTNTIVYGNVASGTRGGGIHNLSGSVNISNSTITKNSAGLGQGVYGPATVKSSIIALNAGGPDIEGDYSSAGFNVIGQRGSSSGFTQPTDQTGTSSAPLDPKLTNIVIFNLPFPLTIQPLCTSPALEKGTSAGLMGPVSTDIRGSGFPRTLDDPLAANAAGGDGTDAGAIERPINCAHVPPTFTVNVTTDGDDVIPGDGVCDSDSSAPGPQCSLRAALQEVNAVTEDNNESPNSEVNFAIPGSQPNCDGGTGACTINLTRELPHVKASTAILGPGADRLTVRRQTGGDYRIFTIESPAQTVTILGLTVSNGSTDSAGGGIALLSRRTLNVISCRITDNFAATFGGGIFNTTGTLNVSDSTISNNSTDGFGNNGQNGGGGGIAFVADFTSGVLLVSNSTISNNISRGHGGGILSGLGISVNITNSRFIGNAADKNSSVSLGGGLLLTPNLSSGSTDFNIRNCQFIGNRAKGAGGAASLGFGSFDGTITVSGSTFSDNLSGNNQGGGIHFQRGKLFVIESTISNNKGVILDTIFGAHGGGIYVQTEDSSATPELNVINSTISGNDSAGNIDGGISQVIGTLNISNSTVLGGVQTSFGKVSLKSSIVDHVRHGSNTLPITSGGFNLIGDSHGSFGLNNGVNSDQIGNSASPLDPKLEPLANNGGPTQTHALRADSLALDKGTSSSLAGVLDTDQRGVGFARTVDNANVPNATGGDGTDIGAFELDPAAPTPTPTPTPTPVNISIQDAQAVEPTAGSINMIFTVALSAPAPAGGVSVNFSTQQEAPALNHATAGSDYVTTSGVLNFAAGDQVKTIPVPILADANLAEANETFLVVLSSPVNAQLTDGTATGTILIQNQPGTLVISEIRTSGPAGAGDDFVEVYNNTDSPYTVNDGSGGYGLFARGASCNDAPVLAGIIPNGTLIPARGHYLLVGSAYSLANYGGTGAATGDQTLLVDLDHDANVGLFSTASLVSISSANRLDAIAFGNNTGGTCDLLREGTTLTPLSGSVMEHSYFRDECGKKGDPSIFGGCPTGGAVKDSNNNSDDFVFADTSGAATAAGQRLGAPGPQNSGSPRLNLLVPALLLDTTKGATTAPNRLRDTTPQSPNATNGTLSIRRRFVNNTGANITRLRFRVVDISAFPTSGAVADVRALTSTTVTISGVADSATCLASTGSATTPCTVAVLGTTLDQPPGQALGGALNSSMSAGTITLSTPLSSGASINLQFVLGIQRTGSFKFFVNVEALP